MHYDQGQPVRVIGTFQQNGANADPTTLGFTYTDPTGVQTRLTYPADTAIVKSAVGVYYVDLANLPPGSTSYRWWSTGVGEAATKGTIDVDADPNV